MRDWLLGILNLVLHLTLADLELDLALLLQLGEKHESLVILSVVEKSADLIDGLASLHGLIHLVDTQSIVHLLLSSIWQFLHILEVDHCWLHVV